MPNLNEIREVFQRAMQSGWGTNPEKSTIVDLPGSKMILYQEDWYRVVDCWFTNPFGDHSWGFIMIWERTGEVWNPVWVMQFGGWYVERAIPVVKSALTDLLKNRQFYGGRGAPAYTMNGMRYRNLVRENHFHRFRGREEVTDIGTGELLGFHEYSGMVLFGVD